MSTFHAFVSVGRLECQTGYSQLLNHVECLGIYLVVFILNVLPGSQCGDSGGDSPLRMKKTKICPSPVSLQYFSNSYTALSNKCLVHNRQNTMSCIIENRRSAAVR